MTKPRDAAADGGALLPFRLPGALLVLAAVTACGAAPPEQVRDASFGDDPFGMDGEVRHPAVDSLFADLEEEGGPGASVLVLDGGAVAHRAGHGMADLEQGVPLAPSSVFDVASVAKPLTGMAIALLAEDGALSVEDDVRDHVPEFPDFGEPIRIRHLLHHTSGLRDWPGTLRAAGWDYADIISYHQILEMARHQEDLNFPPGEQYTYSNTGYNLLAEIVTRVTDTPFARWKDENLFGPLGMEDTHVQDHHGRLVPNRAVSYRPGAVGLAAQKGEASDGLGYRRVSNLLTAMGSSSLFTTVDDLGRWLLHLADPDGRAGGAAVVERMREEGELDSGEGVGYAYGLSLGEHRGLETLGHGGSWAGYRTQVLYYPEEDFGVVVLGNRSDLNAGARSRQVAVHFLEDAMEDTDSGRSRSSSSRQDESEPDPEVDPEDYVGEYRSDELRTSYRIEERDGELVLWHFRRGEFVLSPRGDDVLASRALGVMEFDRDGDGAVTGFRATLGQRNRDLRFERVR